MDVPVTLRPVVEYDLTDLERMLNQPELTRPYNWYGFENVGRLRRRFDKDGLLNTDHGILMVDNDDGRVGFVSWHRVETGMLSYCWNIGINILPERRGNGYGTAAQILLVRYLFAHTQVNRIEAGTEITNLAEQRSLEKAGFTREGVLRGVAFRNGSWHDNVLYSILRGEVDLDSHDTW